MKKVPVPLAEDRRRELLRLAGVTEPYLHPRRGWTGLVKQPEMWPSSLERLLRAFPVHAAHVLRTGEFTRKWKDGSPDMDVEDEVAHALSAAGDLYTGPFYEILIDRAASKAIDLAKRGRSLDDAARALLDEAALSFPRKVDAAALHTAPANGR